MYIGGPTAVLLLIGSVIWEDMGPASEGWVMVAGAPTAFLAAFAMSFLVNLSCFLAIHNTSSLTFKVCLSGAAVGGVQSLFPNI